LCGKFAINVNTVDWEIFTGKTFLPVWRAIKIKYAKNTYIQYTRAHKNGRLE